ncbi:MAG TPA: hypothetical protein VFL59_07645 [Candidatus Nanopelagicales bacterium]|nr:hypothetical protein [Candidatus Nanopelagicales bacterium]
MCRQVSCRRCGKATWAGCGQHVDQVLRAVPKALRCTCPPEPSLLAKLFSRSRTTV